MNRRSFLRLLGGTAVVALVDPKLLWKPGATTHFLPPAQGWKAAAAHPCIGLFNPSADLAKQYREGILFHRNAFEFTMEDLEVDADYQVNLTAKAAKHLAEQVDADCLALWRDRLETASASHGTLHAGMLRDREFYKGDQWASVIREPARGISLRYVREYSIQTDALARFNIIEGFATLRPDLKAKA